MERTLCNGGQGANCAYCALARMRCRRYEIGSAPLAQLFPSKSRGTFAAAFCNGAPIVRFARHVISRPTHRAVSFCARTRSRAENRARRRPAVRRLFGTPLSARAILQTSSTRRSLTVDFARSYSGCVSLAEREFERAADVARSS